MRTYPLNEARSEFSKVFERALAGEPQRVTRHGKEAVVIVAESQWEKRPKSAPNLVDFLLGFAFDDEGDDLFARSHFRSSRPLGAVFLDDD